VILALRNWDLRWGGSDGKGAAAVNLTVKKTGKVIDGCCHKPESGSFSFSDTNAVMRLKPVPFKNTICGSATESAVTVH
jgi:hypothetical protein